MSLRTKHGQNTHQKNLAQRRASMVDDKGRKKWPKKELSMTNKAKNKRARRAAAAKAKKNRR